MRLLWIDRSGWQLLGGDVAGSWVDSEPWPGVLQVLSSLPSAGPVTLIVSPEFFLYCNGPLQSDLLPAELANRNLGLTPGNWQLLSQGHEGRMHLVCLTHEVAEGLESLMAVFPHRLEIRFVPLSLPSFENQLAVLGFGQKKVLVQFDDSGHLKQWHWVPASMAAEQGHPQLALCPFLLEHNADEWLNYYGEVTASFAVLGRAGKWLFSGFVFLCLCALLLWGGWLLNKEDYQRQYQQSSRYLADKGDEAQRLQGVQESGNLAWNQLVAIQQFSNRTKPVSNGIVMMANIADPDITWSSLEIKDRRFTLVLKGNTVRSLLDYADKVRGLPSIEALSFEELKNRNRNNFLQVKIEGKLK